MPSKEPFVDRSHTRIHLQRPNPTSSGSPRDTPKLLTKDLLPWEIRGDRDKGRLQNREEEFVLCTVRYHRPAKMSKSPRKTLFALSVFTVGATPVRDRTIGACGEGCL